MGFMLVEVGLVQKLGLLMGNPGYAIAIVLATLILSTGIGSLVSERLFANGLLDFRRTVAILLALLLVVLLQLDRWMDVLLPLGTLTKALIVIAGLFPLGLLMGQLFPQGLRYIKREGDGLVEWAWAINGATSTVAAGLGIVFSQPLGFNAILLAGVVCYGVVLLLPAYRTAEHLAASDNRTLEERQALVPVLEQ